MYDELCNRPSVDGGAENLRRKTLIFDRDNLFILGFAIQLFSDVEVWAHRVITLSVDSSLRSGVTYMFL